MGEKNNGYDESENGATGRHLLPRADSTVVAANTTKVEVERSTLRYKLTEIPPIPICLFVAMQHVLLSLAGALTISSVISDTLCADPDHVIRARLFATTLAMQGVCTTTQTLLGVRLPVFQGPSSSFLVPLFAISKHRDWVCPDKTPTVVAMNSSDLMTNVTVSSLPLNATMSLDEKLQQFSGSLMVASMVEVIVGGMGLVRPLLRYIGPLTVAPTISLIGLSLYHLPVMYAKYNPAVALGSAVLVIVFSLYMSKIQLPLPSCGKGRNNTRMPIFQLLPILMAIIVMWLVCAILTVTNAVPDNKDHPLYYSRTDAKVNIISNTPWFYIPYPGQFGPPSFSVAAAIGFGAAIMASLVESVGDYFAAAKCCEVMPPPDHAISRGLLLEGLGSVLSGAVGAAHSTTSYSGNIAMISLTQIASRSVLVATGIILFVLSLVGKVGACAATVPLPILGGINMVVLGLLATLGLSTLKYADMTSHRNLLIIGVALLSGLSIPAFVQEYGHMMETGNKIADQVIGVVLGTPMFLGGLIAMILDNTVHGTEEERGLIKWRKSHFSDTQETDNTVDTRSPEDSTKENGNAESSRPPPSDDIAEVRSGALTEDEVYGFHCLRNRSGRFWRYIPFLPPVPQASTERTQETLLKNINSDAQV